MNAISRRLILIGVIIIEIFLYWLSITIIEKINFNTLCNIESCTYWGFKNSIFVTTNILLIGLANLCLYSYFYPNDITSYQILRSSFIKKYQTSSSLSREKTLKNWRSSSKYFAGVFFVTFLLTYYFQVNTYLVIKKDQIYFKKPPVVLRTESIPVRDIKILYYYDYHKSTLRSDDYCELKIFLKTANQIIDLSQYAIGDGGYNGKKQLIHDFKINNVPVLKQDSSPECNSKPNL